MNTYSISAIVSFALFSMGFSAFLAGGYNAYENRRSRSSLWMFFVTVCVFFWNFGYAWMGLCYESDFAYVPRAIALLAVTLYMFFVLIYVSEVTHYPRKRLKIVLSLFLICSLIAWFFVIKKSAVTFTMTAWGYWYYSSMSWARIFQFACVMAALIQYYFILVYGIKHSSHERQKNILKLFMWYGPILCVGYTLDTLVPTLFDIAAVPGSCIGAFFSVLILFQVSQKNKVFGLSENNVSQYVFRDVNIPVIITDEQGMITLSNDYATEYLSCSEEDLTGETMDRFFLIGSDPVIQVNGSDRECKLEKTEVRDKWGDLVYTIYFVQDITEAQKAYRIAEENRSIAEEASKAKSNFLANMSHEIRTPMNAIIGMSDILMEDKSLSQEAHSRVTDIHNAGSNLLGIINDILDISKIELGKYELVPEKYEMASMINDISSIIDVRLYESSIKFELQIDSTFPLYLKGDSLRVREILMNVIGNAVKFTRKGSITLIMNWDHNPKTPTLFFTVEDTGIGIKPEDMESIFEKFSQVDTKKNRGVQGTGLGLAISRNLAVLMGGDIEVESKYGEGSTFHIRIVQEIEKYEAIGDKRVEGLKNRTYKTIIKKQEGELEKYPDAKALIVDDTKINLKVASHILKRYEISVDTAESGAEAIEKVQNTDYDIVFMDHMMPEMDGVEATKRIRELGEKYENLTIVALTANAIGDAREMFLSEGLQDFIAKPIDLKVMDAVLNRWLSK